MASKTNAVTPSASVGALPAFFQNAPGTVLDELADFELGGELEDDGLALEEDNTTLTEANNLDPANEAEGYGDDDILSQMIGESVNQSIAEAQEKAFAPSDTTVTSLPLESENPPHLASRGPQDALPQAKLDFQTPPTHGMPVPFPYGVPYGSPFPQGMPAPMHMLPPGMPMMYPGMMPPIPYGFPGMPPMPPMPLPYPLPPQQFGYSNQPPPPPPQQPHPASNQGQQQTKPKPYPQLPRGQMMGPSDVRFVVSKALQGLEQVDCFNEDYYYIQLMLKKQRQQEEAKATGVPVENSKDLSYFQPPPPMWTDTKTRILGQMDESKVALHQKTRLWEEKEQVLGHTQRSVASHPRAILSVPSVWQQDEEEEEEGEGEATSDGDLRVKQLFSSRLWSMRQSVQRGYRSLGTVQELEALLLRMPRIANSEEARNEVHFHIQSALLLLAQSLGIRVSPQDEFKSDSECHYSLDGNLVAALMQTCKGKKLISRSFLMLAPEQRWVLIPVIIARVVQGSHSSQTAEEASVEKQLLKSIHDFVKHSKAHQLQVQGAVDADVKMRYQYQLYQQQQMHQQGPPIPVPTPTPSPFTLKLLTHLRVSLKSVVMVSVGERKDLLRQSLLGCRPRAEVLHTIVQVGDSLTEWVDEALKVDWASIRDTFMSKLDD